MLSKVMFLTITKTVEDMKITDRSLLDIFSAQAKESLRLRMNYNFVPHDVEGILLVNR